MPEITSQADLNTFCIDKPGVCVVGFLTLESDFPESVEAHKANLAILSALKKKYYDLKSPFHFAWINFINHGRKLAKDFDVRYKYFKYVTV